MIPKFRELKATHSQIEDFWQMESVVPQKSEKDILLRYDKLK